MVRPKQPISRRARTAAFPSQPTGLLVWARPDVVEGGQVEVTTSSRDPPVRTWYRPAVDQRRWTPPTMPSIGERRDAVTIADQHITRVHPEVPSTSPSPTEVRQHRVDPLVVTAIALRQDASRYRW